MIPAFRTSEEIYGANAVVPTISKTIIPRIRKSLRDRGLALSLCRSFLLPLHLIKEYRANRDLPRDAGKSDFDQSYSVNTDGEYGGWTYLSDLAISSQNWVEGNDYRPIEPHRFAQVVTALRVPFEQFTFVDFGSGKGRALLLASEYPFRRIIGLEFAPELHRVAEENIRRYRSPGQKCRDIQSQNTDFMGFQFPKEPLILFFFDPCRERVLEHVLKNIRQSLRADPRPAFLAYVAPRAGTEKLLSSLGFFTETHRDINANFRIYRIGDISSS